MSRSTKRDLTVPLYLSDEIALEFHDWFLIGEDTLTIAKEWRVPEAIVLYGVNLVRSRKRHLPSPYRKTGAAS